MNLKVLAALSLYALAFGFTTAHAQRPMCGFTQGGGFAQEPAHPDRGAAFQEVVAICRVHGAAPIPVFSQRGVNNALAFPPVLNRTGYIVFDPDFFNGIVARHGRAATVGILAHEVGHILTGIRVPNMIADWSDEARADYFAGYTLARMNISRRGVQSWLATEGFFPSHRHPDGFTRIQIVENGYIAGGGNPFSR
tara:strand:+ start:1121 stop:1705 length:585 start_codon:yes stop_codon:yes gene_type:complete